MHLLGILAVVLSGVFCLAVFFSPNPHKYKHLPRGRGSSSKPQDSNSPFTEDREQ